MSDKRLVFGIGFVANVNYDRLLVTYVFRGATSDVSWTEKVTQKEIQGLERHTEYLQGYKAS